MWNLKVDVIEEKGIFTELSQKYSIEIQYTPLNNYSDNKYNYFVSAGYIIGDEEQIKRALKDLKKNNKTTYLETHNNYFILTYKEPKQSLRAKQIKKVYNPKFIFSKPVLVDSKGVEHWNVNTIERSDLDILLKLAEENKNVKYKLKRLNKQKVSDVVTFSIIPKLSPQQRKAISLAIEEGYYECPRKTTIEKLAVKMKISKSTFQEHLVNAERKLIPSIATRFN